MHTGQETAEALAFASLKKKQRGLRTGFPPAFGLRVHRALSWFGRAEGEMERQDFDAAFIFLWIAFNAAYAREISEADNPAGERHNFSLFFEQLMQVDTAGRLHGVIWQRFPEAIRQLLTNRYVFHPFWQHHNGVPGYENWEKSFSAAQKRAGEALFFKDSATVLSILFDRLYVLRNQIVHGGATWNSGVNRAQVAAGASMLAALVPLFIDLMMDNPQADWGTPHYPVVERG